MPRKTIQVDLTKLPPPHKRVSPLEESFFGLCKLLMPDHPEPTRELTFAKPRRWRFDFAWPDKMLAVEIEGGTWSRGGHNRGGVYQSNCDKYNAAILLGWRVLRFTGDDVRKAPAQMFDQIKQAYNAEL